MPAFEKLYYRKNSSRIERAQRAVRVERPNLLYFNSFRNCQRIFKFNAQIPDRAVHLRMPQQKLNGAQVARFLIDLGDLRASH